MQFTPNGTIRRVHTMLGDDRKLHTIYDVTRPVEIDWDGTKEPMANVFTQDDYENADENNGWPQPSYIIKYGVVYARRREEARVTITDNNGRVWEG